MKVLIALEQRMRDDTLSYPQFARAEWLARQICVAHGYDYDVVTAGNLGTTYSADDYEFVIIPRIRDINSWGAGGTDLTQFYDGTWGKPCFVLSTHARFSSYILNNLGALDTGTNSTKTGKLLWGDRTVYSSYIPHVADSGQDVTAIVTEAGDATQMVAWRVNGLESNVYCDASDVQSSQIFGLFPILLQTAIDNGEVSAPPAKGKIAFDLDDFPDATTTLADAEAVYGVAEAYQLPMTIGINPAIDASVDADVLAYCASKSAINGGYFYPIVHNTSANFYTVTPATNLASSTGLPYMVANGFLADGDNSQGGYLYFPNNAVDDDFMQLAAGYGVKVARFDGLGSALGRLFEPIGIERKQTYKGVTMVGSTSQLSTGDINITVDSAAEIVDFSIMFGDYMMRAPYAGQVPYLHGSNFYDGHDGGNAPGLRFLNIIGAAVAGCADVLQFTRKRVSIEVTMSNQHKSVEFQFEAKEADNGEMTIKGYGSVFGNLDRGGDIMEAGCFSDTLTKRTPKMAWQHSTWDICGMWTKAQEDSRGLYLEGKFANTTLGRDCYELTKMGAIDGLSIGYTVRESERGEDGRRLIKEVDLYEVSLVTFPMNEEATITQVKNEIKTIREFEAALRDVMGFSQARAKAIASHGFKEASNHRDDGLDEVSNALAQFNQLLGVKTDDGSNH